MSGRFYEWFYVNTEDNSVAFPDDVQHKLETKYYQKVHQLYDREQIFVPAVVIRSGTRTEVINIAEMQRIVEENRKFSMFPIYRVPKFQSSVNADRTLAIQDLGKCRRWVVKARADTFVLNKSAFFESVHGADDKKPAYQAFKVHSIAGENPSVRATSMQLMPHLPLIVSNIGQNSFGRNWELPQIMFSAHSKSTDRLLGLHIQITPEMASESGLNLAKIGNNTIEFEFRPHDDCKIVRKGAFEYLCLEGKMVQSQANVCMVVGVHVFNSNN